MIETVLQDRPTTSERLALRPSEAAELLGVCYQTVRRWRARGLLKFNRANRISGAELDRFLAEDGTERQSRRSRRA